MVSKNDFKLIHITDKGDSIDCLFEVKGETRDYLMEECKKMCIADIPEVVYSLIDKLIGVKWEEFETPVKEITM